MPRHLKYQDLLDVFLLVLLSHLNVLTIGDQIDCNNFTETIVVCGKVQLQNVSDIIVPMI